MRSPTVIVVVRSHHRVAAQGGQKGERFHAELPCAEWRFRRGWLRLRLPQHSWDGKREERRVKLRPRGRMRVVNVVRQSTWRATVAPSLALGIPFL